MGGAVIEVVLPVKTVTESNAKEHWRSKAARAKRQREPARLLVTAHLRQDPERTIAVAAHDRGVVVTMTRVSPGLLDDDNLASAVKHVRDGIADALGLNDRDPRVTWRPEQRRGPRGTYAVEIRIERRDPARITKGVVGDGVNIHSPERTGGAPATTGPATAPGREWKGAT